MDTAAYEQLILFPDLFNDLVHTCTCTHPHIKQLIVVGQSGLTEGTAIQLCLMAASCWCLTWHTLWLWRWRQYSPLKHQWTSTGLYSTISQKTGLFLGSACCLLLASCLTYPLPLEAVCSSEMSEHFYSTWCYIPNESSLHIHCLLPAYSLTLKPETVISSIMSVNIY
jgi:hypothetical protein